MRIAIVSDIHGNLTAFEAVLADLEACAPDLVLHGGDLADGGASPVEIVDRIRDLGWPGVMGNTDEMLIRPESLEAFAASSPAMQAVVGPIREMAAFTRDELGDERLAWLRGLPRVQQAEELILFHASLDSCWRAIDADVAEFDRKVAVYGHIHQPFVRRRGETVIANSGSVGLPYDGDRRAAYLIVEGAEAAVRRVEYDVDREVRRLLASKLPHADWTVRMLTSARPALP